MLMKPSDIALEQEAESEAYDQLRNIWESMNRGDFKPTERISQLGMAIRGLSDSRRFSREFPTWDDSIERPQVGE